MPRIRRAHCWRLSTPTIDRAGLQMPAAGYPSALVYDARSRLSVYNAMADSVVINFSCTMVIINSTVDNPWHDISGEIHPIYFILYIAFFKNSNYSGLQSCLMQDPKPPYWCKFKGR